MQTEDFTSKLKTKVQTNKDKPDPKSVEPKQIDFRDTLKKKSVQTKVNQQFKTEQVDFRTALKNQGKFFSEISNQNPLLGVKTKVLKQEELKSATGEQKDFRTNLKKSVKTKALEQDDLKKMKAEQKDFRSQLKPLAGKSSRENSVEKGLVTICKTLKKCSFINHPEKELEKEPSREPTPPKEPTPPREPTPEPAPKTPEPVEEPAKKSSQIAPRKRKPKITKFPDDIVECTVDGPFEIELEVFFDIELQKFHFL